MSVVYASPNRSHHFPYAEGLYAGGLLSAFIQGYPRFKQLPNGVPKSKVHHRDLAQIAFIPLFRVLNEHSITHHINMMSKTHIDAGLCKAMADAQIGLFYNGCGLNSLRKWQGSGKQFVCEAVNSHLDYQSELLREECEKLGLSFREPYEPEREKRLAEYRESNYILCPSQFVARSFTEKGIPSEKLLVNPFGVSAPTFVPDGSCDIRSASISKEDRFRVIYVGSINFRKGLRYLLEGFKKLNHPRKELWIVGPRLAPDGISDLSIPKGVEFKGVLKNETLQSAYLSADVFVQPSIEEGLSLVIGEALGYGLPVIATCNTGAEDIFQDGECGNIIPIRDANAIADKLQRLVDDPQLLKSLSQHAIEKSRNFGGWKASQQGLCKLMKSILPTSTE